MIKIDKKIAEDIIEVLNDEVNDRISNFKSFEADFQTSESFAGDYKGMLRATKMMNNHLGYIYGIHAAIYELRNCFSNNKKTKNHLSSVINRYNFDGHFWIDKFMTDNINSSRIIENIDVIEETNSNNIILNKIIRLMIISNEYLIKPLKSMFILKKKVDVLDFQTGINNITRLMSFVRGLHFSIGIIMRETGVSFEDLSWRFPYYADECNLIIDSLNNLEIEINKELDLGDEKVGFDFSLIA
ncbi:hypothetical protein DFR79_11443 [Halanaerobium saccharolyticum]|uniref:Uncharacterized protein n=1 Tax=Halanaerobium saccharolyticum TaxID=43595 RepID=A0A4R6LQE0_9FIRM|nr:hypothetical protein [Halanaerobium saccharolyticum]TDO86471.1 hypothetical protein DFR79_11443 [Halanaerobium saccharolyticum]